MFYDIHCHLDRLDDIPSVIDRAKKAGVSFILTNGVDVASNRRSLELAKKYDIVEPALGIYPNDSLKLSDDELQAELDFIAQARPKAIGEVGIDLHHDTAHFDEMKAVFERFLELAERINRPVLIHSRKAEKEVLDILESFNVTADLHCFGGSLKLARRGFDAGHYFSVPTSVVRATHFQRLIEEAPLKLLLSETDSPYLSPGEFPNEPANVTVVSELVAKHKDILPDEAQRQLWMNAQDFLR